MIANISAAKFRFPRIRKAVLSNFSLYSLKPRIEVEFPDGVFCLAGANGLGKSAHQQCLAHLQRRCETLLETASRGAARFPRAVLHRIDRAYALRRAWR
ncbi:MAG TPA: hypothetical protein VHX65_09410, partial [Pirellulales bacterium]|nr:hypothetical protein [Pirellulales bacterium]